MSLYIPVTVVCDVCFTSLDCGACRPANALADAKHRGWARRRVDGRAVDLCPSHAEMTAEQIREAR